ncbi:C6 transcription factor [Rhodotorula toruloides]|uniref:C6 transcription factor n=1 Tax=Rhodotorula toruloides TaxID=5286 RepID=A0A511KIJ1_RHOTO|nr:C6 transcription factor [Rhodotorula toruloides]
MSDQRHRWEQQPQYGAGYDRAAPRPTSYHEQQYAAYDFARQPSSTASAPLSEYRPHTGHFPPPAYPSSHSSSNRSRSSSAEQQGIPSQALVHSTYVIPSQPAGHHNTLSQETISPSSIHQHQVSASPMHCSPPTPLVDIFPPGAFSRPDSRSHYAPPSLRRAPSFPNSRNGSSNLPAGLVSNVDTWTGNSASTSTSSVDLTGPPTIELSRPPVGRKKTSTITATEKQVPRRRVPASCTPCRKKKLRCNSDAVPLYTARQDNDVKELKAQVDRLQHLLDALSRAPPHAPRLEPPVAPRPIVRPKEAPTPPHPRFDLNAQDLCGALSGLALVGAPSQQAVGCESFAPGGTSGPAFIYNAGRFLAASDKKQPSLPTTVLTPTSGAPSPPFSGATSPEQSTTALSPSTVAVNAALLNVRPTILQVLELLPSDAELTATYKFYASHIHSLSSQISLGAFEHRWSAFRVALAQPDATVREKDVDPFFVATLLGACATGLASMTNEQAKSRGFPETRTHIVERWVHAAMLSLVAGKFIEAPTVDGVRAAVIVATIYIELFMSSDESVSAGNSLLSLSVHAVFTLGLNRDPANKSTEQLSFFECEERRRLFWSVFSLCASVTTGLSCKWPQFDLKQINCKFPLDCYDAELLMDERAAKARVRARQGTEQPEETPVTAPILRAQYALLVKKITDQAFSIEPCTYSDVLALDAELRAFEASFPPVYRLPVDSTGRIRFTNPPSLAEMRAASLHLCLSAEFVRLHRPFLVLAATDDIYQHSREQCVKYAKRLLAINATPGCRLNWAGHAFKVFSGAVALAVELLQSPGEPDVPMIRSALNAVVNDAEGSAAASTVCRKASSVVRFILAKVDEEAASSTHPRTAKRARTLFYNPDDPRNQRRSLAQTLGGAPSNVSSRSNSPEPRERRRKLCRPPLTHVASDTIVPQATVTSQAVAGQAAAIIRRNSRSRSVDEAFPTINALAETTAHPIEFDQQSIASPLRPVFTGYPVAPPARQIAKLGGTFSRGMSRHASPAVKSVTGTSGGSVPAMSSPEMGLSLQIPPLANSVTVSTSFASMDPLSSASTTGHFDFAELTLTGSAAPPTASMIDGRAGEMFFTLPATALGINVSQQSDYSPNESDIATGGGNGLTGGRGGRSRFNDPMEEEGLEAFSGP